jgi:hypothetical protein
MGPRRCGVCGEVRIMRDHWTVCSGCHGSAKARLESWHWQLDQAVKRGFTDEEKHQLRQLHRARGLDY